MVMMEQILEHMNRDLHYLEKACRAWCTEEGLEFTVGTRLAHCILDYCTARTLGVPPPADILPRPSEDKAAWRTLSEWRHPQINFNLLQLAIVLQRTWVLEYLWQPVFLQEEDYRDDSSHLVNHPLHLQFKFGRERKINLDYIRDELFYEEGLIDLTPSRMLKLTHEQSSLAASGLPNASVLEFHFSPVCRTALKKMESDFKYTDNLSLFRQPESIRMASLYDLNHILNVVRKLSGPQAQPSTVELVWAIATSTTSFRNVYHPWGLFLFDNIAPSHKQELLILLCQCIVTVTDGEQKEGRLGDLFQLLRDFPPEKQVHIEKAVRFLPADDLEKMIRNNQHLELYEYIRPVPTLSRVLKDQLACKSLRDLCVLTVLEAVRGDARKVWSLEQLAEPLKQLFHIPFQETYEELKAGEQG